MGFRSYALTDNRVQEAAAKHRRDREDMAQAKRDEPEKRRGDRRKQEALKQEELMRRRREDEIKEQRRWKQKCAGCRKRGHTIEDCPCKSLQGNERKGSESEEGSKEKAKQDTQPRSGCGKKGHRFLDGECPLLQDEKRGSRHIPGRQKYGKTAVLKAARTEEEERHRRKTPGKEREATPYQISR